MTDKQAMLERLERAYYSGVLKVREGDQWIEYQSARQMRVAIDDLKTEIVGKKQKARRIFTSNGY